MILHDQVGDNELTGRDLSTLYEEWSARSASDPEHRVEELLENLSQGIWAASWLQDMHLVAWDLLFDPPERGDALPYYDSLHEALRDIAELRRLTVDAGWWPVYTDDAHRTVGWRVPIDEWSERQSLGRRVADLPPTAADPLLTVEIDL